MLKAERKNQEVLVNKFTPLKNIFSRGTPQERKDNFLNFYMSGTIIS